MRYVIMSISVLVLLSFQDIMASARTDSIVDFLGGVHAKFVWARWAWCNDDYTPKTETAATAEGMSLMLLDTREGTERKVMSGLPVNSEYFSRISRSGKWATVPVGSEQKSNIVDLTADSPEQKVLLANSSGCSYWVAGAWWIDPNDGTEYVFCYDDANGGMYKVKVNDDGTADLPGTRIEIDGADDMDWAYSVSADGTKLGGAFPWPDCKILDIATGSLQSRHAGGFGCQANLAPDNSYRFFHCQGEHTGIMMFGSDLSDPTNWYVNLGVNLAGFPNPTGDLVMDFIAPRWSNHVQYMTGAFPMGDNHDSYFEGGQLGIWGESATWVQNSLEITNMPQVFLGKFSADFQEQEKSILIASDPRYVQLGGDSWICNGVTDGTPCGEVAASDVIRTGKASNMRIQRAGSLVTIHTGFGASAVIRISDAQGRIIRTWSGAGTCTFDAQDLAAGAYLVSVFAAGRRSNETGRTEGSMVYLHQQ